MELTVKKKAFLEELPDVVREAVEEYGTALKGIEIKEDEKGCYTVMITYEREPHR
ncbi:hypothetical protein [Thermococcus profundus]|uniref:hypothetical protein n=1 Tax=Thermococcus profundus TaxID=49899 RepID=UPI0018DF779C|nr:hypothetical protein [Thermococcus profundus]